MEIYRKGFSSYGTNLTAYVYGKGLRVLTKGLIMDNKRLEDQSRGEVGYFSYGFEYLNTTANTKVTIAPMRSYVFSDPEEYQRINLLSSAYQDYSIFRIHYHIYRTPSNTSDYAREAFYKPYSHLYKLKLGMFYQWNYKD